MLESSISEFTISVKSFSLGEKANPAGQSSNVEISIREYKTRVFAESNVPRNLNRADAVS
jgi:hypothetical protein